MPAISRAKSAAKSTQGLGQLRQIGLPITDECDLTEVEVAQLRTLNTEQEQTLSGIFIRNALLVEGA